MLVKVALLLCSVHSSLERPSKSFTDAQGLQGNFLGMHAQNMQSNPSTVVFVLVRIRGKSYLVLGWYKLRRAD